MFRVSEYLLFRKTPRRGRVPSPPLRREPPFWCKADREGLGRSPPSVPPNPPWGSKRERLAPLPAFEGPRHAAAMRVVPQRFAPLSLGRQGRFLLLFLERKSRQKELYIAGSEGRGARMAFCSSGTFLPPRALILGRLFLAPQAKELDAAGFGGCGGHIAISGPGTFPPLWYSLIPGRIFLSDAEHKH